MKTQPFLAGCDYCLCRNSSLSKASKPGKEVKSRLPNRDLKFHHIYMLGFACLRCLEKVPKHIKQILPNGGFMVFVYHFIPR